MKKTSLFILHIPFILLLWLCVTSPFFINNNILNSSFGFIFKGIENIANNLKVDTFGGWEGNS